MIHGVFFDLYGTLFIYGDMQSGWTDLIATFRRAVMAKGCAISSEMITSYYQLVMSRPPQPSMDGTSRFEHQLEDVCREIGVRLTDYELGELADQCVNAWHKYTHLDPQSLPLLKTLRQTCHTALITNFDYPTHVKRILRETELAPLFDVTLISDTVGFSKPDRRIFEMALAKTNLQAANAIFVGDSIEDIQGASEAGMQPVYLHRPSTPALDLASLPKTKVITQLAELTGWLTTNGHEWNAPFAQR